MAVGWAQALVVGLGLGLAPALGRGLGWVTERWLACRTALEWLGSKLGAVKAVR